MKTVTNTVDMKTLFTLLICVIITTACGKRDISATSEKKIIPKIEQDRTLAKRINFLCTDDQSKFDGTQTGAPKAWFEEDTTWYYYAITHKIDIGQREAREYFRIAVSNGRKEDTLTTGELRRILKEKALQNARVEYLISKLSTSIKYKQYFERDNYVREKIKTTLESSASNYEVKLHAKLECFSFSEDTITTGLGNGNEWTCKALIYFDKEKNTIGKQAPEERKVFIEQLAKESEIEEAIREYKTNEESLKFRVRKVKKEFDDIQEKSSNISISPDEVTAMINQARLIERELSDDLLNGPCFTDAIKEFILYYKPNKPGEQGDVMDDDDDDDDLAKALKRKWRRCQ